MGVSHDPGALDENWKKEGLAAIADSLEAERCLRVKLLIVYENQETYPRTPEWAGTVTVQVEELKLREGKRVAKAKGEGRFWGRIGAIGGPQAAVPFALGTTLGRAVDKAARVALEELISSREGGEDDFL